MHEYKIQLDVFNGPLDLLLYLIKRDELDILDIPIAHITTTYVEYVDILRRHERLNIDDIGEFLVMAATLMEIKSALLLPTPPAISDSPDSAAEQLVDPRTELIRQLLEYKRIKDHANLLEQHQKQFANRFPRYPARIAADEDVDPPLDLDEVQVWDLLSAFNRIMGEIGTRVRQHEVVDDDTPIELHAADIEDRLQRDGKLTLRQLLFSRRSRSEMIGAFLALLELIRQKRIIAERIVTQPLSSKAIDAGEPQDGADVPQAPESTDSNTEIAFIIAPPEHRRTFPQASLHLADA
jgi:segregation and condensation protein A